MKQTVIGGACALAVLACSLLSSCSSTQETAPARIVIDSQDITDGTLALHKGDSALVGVVAYDANGNKVTPNSGAYHWTSADPAVLTAKTLGSAALIRGDIDYFGGDPPPPEPDAGTDGGVAAETGADAAPAPAAQPTPPVEPHEPTTTLRVIYGHGDDSPSAEVRVAIVLNVAGRWQANIEKLGVQELTLEQHGRNVNYIGASTQASGTVNGNVFSLNQQGFVLSGTFSSRTEVAGSYTGPGGVTGNWAAKKIQ